MQLSTPRFFFYLERSNPTFFLQDTLAYDAVLSNQVWLLMDQQFGRYSRNSHILIILALAVTLTLKTVYHHTMFGWAVQEISSGQHRTHGHDDRQTDGWTEWFHKRRVCQTELSRCTEIKLKTWQHSGRVRGVVKETKKNLWCSGLSAWRRLDAYLPLTGSTLRPSPPPFFIFIFWIVF